MGKSGVGSSDSSTPSRIIFCITRRHFVQLLVHKRARAYTNQTDHFQAVATESSAVVARSPKKGGAKASGSGGVSAAATTGTPLTAEEKVNQHSTSMDRFELD